MGKTFNIADVFGTMPTVPDSGTSREQIEYIDSGKISGDPNNFYSVDGIAELAANIELIGLQQPIRVRPDPDDEGGYIIVSGHRRFAAMAELRKSDREKWQMIPCIIEQTEENPAMRELRLIYANADTRKLSSADLDKQAQRVETLLYELKEAGYEFPGRMRDYVAKACNVSKTKLSNLRVIREGLASCWKKPYEDGTIKEATALVLARMKPGLQMKVHSTLKSKKSNLRYFYESDAKRCEEFFEKDEKRTCRGGAVCENHEGRWLRFVDGNMYSYNSCAGKCCAKCEALGTCRHSCPKQAERVKQIKADRREANRQARLAQEEKDRPAIEEIQRLWYRFGYARQQAKKSVEAVRKAAQTYYSKSDDDKFRELEDLTAKFTPLTNLPYSYSFSLTDAHRLIGIADCLGCSLDYLFCRTDEPNVAQPQGEGQLVLAAWMPAGTLPPEPCDVLAEFDLEGSPYRQLARFDGEGFLFKRGGSKIELPPLRWMRIPE